MWPHSGRLEIWTLGRQDVSTFGRTSCRDVSSQHLSVSPSTPVFLRDRTKGALIFLDWWQLWPYGWALLVLWLVATATMCTYARGWRLTRTVRISTSLAVLGENVHSWLVDQKLAAEPSMHIVKG